MEPTHKIAIVGNAAPDIELIDFACDLAQCLADAGCIVITGGLGPQAASIRDRLDSSAKGAHLIELTPTDSGYLREIPGRLETGLGYLRNYMLVSVADKVVAVGGGSGTLSEIAMAWQLHKPTCVAGTGRGWPQVVSWWLDHRNVLPIAQASSPTDAAKWALSTAKNKESHEELVQRFFDKNAGQEVVASLNEEDMRIAVPRGILRSLAVPGGRALDLGGGSGVDSAFLADQGMQVDYIDISPSLAAVCRTRSRDSDMLRVHVGTWQDMGSRIADASMDLVIALGEALSFSTSPHDRQCFIHLLKRVTKQGSRCLITADSLYGRACKHVADGSFHRASSLLGSQLDTEVSVSFPIYCYTRAQLAGVLRLASFSPETVISYPIRGLRTVEEHLRLGAVDGMEAAGSNVLCLGVRT